jgi:hypothetical protein
MRKRLGHFIETYRGSSFPTRSQTADGELCVVKLRGSGNGSAALLSEFVVNRLASRAGMAVPDVFILDIADGHPWDFGTDEFYDLVQKSSGANLAITLLNGAIPVDAIRYASLPREVVSQVVTLDIAFANYDRSARSANLVEDDSGRYWVIDHGSCRFLFQSPIPGERQLWKDHIFSDMEDAFDPRWLKRMSSSLLSDTVAEIPDAWLADSGLTRDAVRSKIDAHLSSLWN